MGLTVTVLLFAALALPALWLMKQVYNAGMAVAQLYYNVWGRSSGTEELMADFGRQPMPTYKDLVQIRIGSMAYSEGSPPEIAEDDENLLNAWYIAARPASGFPVDLQERDADVAVHQDSSSESDNDEGDPFVHAQGVSTGRPPVECKQEVEFGLMGAMAMDRMCL